MTTVLQRFHGLTARERFCRIGRTNGWERARQWGGRSIGVDKAAFERPIKAQGQSPRRPQADRLQLLWLDGRRFGPALQPRIDGKKPSQGPATGQHRHGAGHPKASSIASQCVAQEAARAIERRDQIPTRRGPFGVSAV